jgi:N utilization substance protein B
MQVLFQQDFTGVEIDSAIEYLLLENELGAKELIFVKQIAQGTLSKQAEIDQEMAKYLIEWSVERLPRVDRALLRIAFYELMYEQETSYRVVLNEAIELAKEYGGPESASFINGVLASYLNNADGVVEE